VSSRSGVATLRTAIHLLLTYLLSSATLGGAYDGDMRLSFNYCNTCILKTERFFYGNGWLRPSSSLAADISTHEDRKNKSMLKDLVTTGKNCSVLQ